MGDYWILDENRKAVPADMETWMSFFEDIEKRRVAWTEIAPGVSVSTVFLGLDHSFCGGPPLLFETMSFAKDGEDVGEMMRYSTWPEAVAGHNDMVEDIRERMGIPLPALPVLG